MGLATDAVDGDATSLELLHECDEVGQLGTGVIWGLVSVSVVSVHVLRTQVVVASGGRRCALVSELASISTATYFR